MANLNSYHASVYHEFYLLCSRLKGTTAPAADFMRKDGKERLDDYISIVVPILKEADNPKLNTLEMAGAFEKIKAALFARHDAEFKDLVSDRNLKNVAHMISNNCLNQEVIEHLYNWPMLHFSEKADEVFESGFKFGEADPFNLDYTLDAGAVRQYPGPGFNFAFNAISWDVENDCHEFEVASPLLGRNLMGMYGESAVLFLGDGLHTHHYDEFQQVIVWEPSIDMKNALLLKRIETPVVDGEPICDENGNPAECWVATNQSGKFVVTPDEHMNLTDCVVKSLAYWHSLGLINTEAMVSMKETYEPELKELNIDVTVKKGGPPKNQSDSGIDPWY